MNHYRTLSPVRLRDRRNRSSALTRLTGVAILLMAATVWPMAVLAADPAVDTQHDAAVVFIVIVLLVGSVTAGLFFSSPMRRRLAHVPDAEAVARPRDVWPAEDLPQKPSAAADHAWPTPGTPAEQPWPSVSQPSVYALREAPSVPPAISAPPVVSTPSRAIAQPPPQPRPTQAPLYVQLEVGTRPVVTLRTTPVQPATAIRPPARVQPQPPRQHRTGATPWSTSTPQPDANWHPPRRGKT